MINKRLIIIIVGSLVTIALLALVANRATLNPFHLKSSSPVNNSTTVGTLDNLHFTFTKPPSADTAKRFSLSPTVAGQATVSGNEVIFTPTAGYVYGSSYTATIKRPTATDGSVGSDVTIKFTTGVTDQPTDQQKKDSLEKTDSLDKTNPFLATLPYDDDQFHMEMQLVDNKTVLNVHLYGVITGGGTTTDAQLIAKYKEQQAAAIAYIKSQGGDPTTYDITFDPSPETGIGTFTQSAVTATNNGNNED